MGLLTSIDGPIAVGGVGGSGTRLMADLLMDMGVFVGDNLNSTNDNMAWPGFRALLQESTATAAQKHDIAIQYLRDFESSMERGFVRAKPRFQRWGWKVPTTYIHLDVLTEYFPKLRYLHLMRHGLDMAYSENQNQLRKWGAHFGVDAEGLPAPVASLRYWIKANRFALRQCEQYAPGRYLVMRFEDICAEPGDCIRRVMQFIGLDPANFDLTALCRLVKPPSSMGRYQHGHDLSGFSAEELDAVREFGFEVNR